MSRKLVPVAVLGICISAGPLVGSASAVSREIPPCFGHTPTIVVRKSDSEQVITGTSESDVIQIFNSSGPRTVYGLGGDDYICGGDAADEIHGGTGNDQIQASGGDNQVWGDGGGDHLIADNGNDVMYGGAGNDSLEGESGSDVLHGGAGNDYLRGNFNDDLLYGDKGDDTLDGGHHYDQLYGGPGNDLLLRHDDGKIDPVVSGGPGADTCWWGKTYEQEGAHISGCETVR